MSTIFNPPSVSATYKVSPSADKVIPLAVPEDPDVAKVAVSDGFPGVLISIAFSPVSYTHLTLPTKRIV